MLRTGQQQCSSSPRPDEKRVPATILISLTVCHAACDEILWNVRAPVSCACRSLARSLARVLRRLSSFDVLLVTDYLFSHPYFKLELRFSFICRKWNIDIVFTELNGILLYLADQNIFRGKTMECTIY